MTVITTQELNNLEKKQPRTKRTVTSAQLFGDDEIFGRPAPKKPNVAEALEPVLRGYKTFEDLLDEPNKKAFTTKAKMHGNVQDYRDRAVAAMLLTEKTGLDYNVVISQLDNVAAGVFGEKTDTFKVIEKLSPIKYNRPMEMTATNGENFFQKAWGNFKEWAGYGYDDIGYYKGSGHLSKEAAKNPIGKLMLGDRPAQEKDTFQRKGFGQSIKHGVRQAGVRMSKSVAGSAQMAGEMTGAESLADWGKIMAEAADEYYAQNPQEAMQLQSNRGLIGTTMQYIQRPEMLVQGLTETVPMLLEAYLGHVSGTKAAQVIGKGTKLLPWAGRVAAIGAESVGTTYSEARASGTEPGAALAQALLTGAGEGIVEEFTLSKKVQVFQGAKGASARKAIATKAKDMLFKILKGYPRGFGEESVQAMNQNFWRMIFTDKEQLNYNFGQRLTEGAAEAAATGGIMEMAMGGGFYFSGKTVGLISDKAKMTKVENFRKMINENEKLSTEQKTEINENLNQVKTEILAGKFGDRGKEAASQFALQIKDSFAIDDKQVAGVMSMLEAVAYTSGKTLQQWISENIAGVEKTTETQFADSLSQEQYNPVWKSKLAEVVNDKMPETIDAGQLKNMLENAGVKAEEMQWAGISEIIDDRLESIDKGKITKSEILDIIAENEVQVQEVVKGEKLYQKSFMEQFKNDVLTNARENNADLTAVEKAIDFIIEEPLDTDNRPTSWAWETLSQAVDDSIDLNRVHDIHDMGVPPEAATKYEQYQLPGGKNYKELLLRMPPKEKIEKVSFEEYTLKTYGRTPSEMSDRLRYKAEINYNTENDDLSPDYKNAYKSSHWDESNVLAHVRFNDRIADDGTKTLFIEEVQSDWHQEGRQKGYKEKSADSSEQSPVSDQQLQGGVADAPFKKSWPNLAFKRMIRWAAQNGYDKIAWTGGIEQVSRYTNATRAVIDRVDLVKTADNSYGIISSKNKRQVYQAQNQSKEDVVSLIGKATADKLFAQIDDGAAIAIVKGKDLTVGGEGMKGFYDDILVSIAKKLTKQSPKQTQIDGAKAWQIDVTDKMVEQAMGGQWLFQLDKQSQNADNTDMANEKAARDIAPSKQQPSGNEGYLYHGTGQGQAVRIQQDGLKAGQASGSPNAPIYFSNKEQYAQTYADRKAHGKQVMLRVKQSPDMEHDKNTGLKGDYKTSNPIPADQIEVKTKDGKWIPLKEYDLIDEQSFNRTAPEDGGRVSGETLYQNSGQQSAVGGQNESIWYKNKLVSETKQKIQTHPMYQVMLEETRENAKNLVFPGRRFYFDATDAGDVKQYVEGKNAIKRLISFEKGKGTPWDSAAAEYAEITNTEQITDVYKFMELVEQSHAAIYDQSGINQAALEKAKRSIDPSFDILTTVYDMVRSGDDAAKINKKVDEMIDGYQLDKSLGGEFKIKTYEQYKSDLIAEKRQKERNTRKAAVTFAKDGKAVIKAFEAADFSSLVHELAHIFRRGIGPKALAVVEEWAGVKGGIWDVKAEEKFARGFERYLWEGKSPNSRMELVFDQFKKWLRKIYSSLKKSPIDVNITDDVRRVFDGLFGEGEIHPGEMTFEDYYSKIETELVKAESPWLERYQIMANETPTQSHRRLKKEYKARLNETKIVSKAKGAEIDLSGLTPSQQAQLLALETDIVPNAANTAKMKSLTVEELLAANERDDIVISELRNQLAAAFVKGKEAGINKATSAFKEQLERRRARKELREYIQTLGRQISARIPATVEIKYREAIKALQTGLDPSFRAVKTLEQREKVRKFMADNPEMKMPVELISEINKKSLNEYTITELEQLARERTRLEKQGKLKKKLKIEADKKRIDDLVWELSSQIRGLKNKKTKLLTPDDVKDSDITIVKVGEDGSDNLYRALYKGYDLTVADYKMEKSIEPEALKLKVKDWLMEATTEPISSDKAKSDKIGKLVRGAIAATLRPMRIFDLLDGGKAKFDGLAHGTFYDAANAATDAKLRMVDARIESGDAKLAQLGLDIKTLADSRVINGTKYSLQEIMGIYGYSLNLKSRLALNFGNKISNRTIIDATWVCEQETPALGDLVRWIIQEFDMHFDRLDEAYIEYQEKMTLDDGEYGQLREQRAQTDENIQLAGLGKEDNYLPMRRQELDYTPDARQMLNEILERNEFKRAYAEKGFTISRQDIPAEFQKPIRLDLWSMWNEQVETQEHFIHLGRLTADMHRIERNSAFKNAVDDTIGGEFSKAITDYVSRVANPHIYKSYGYWANQSRRLRGHAAIAYLAFNVVTMLKQLPSVLYYLQDADKYLFSSFAEFTKNPAELIAKVRALDPQVKHVAMERTLEELKTSERDKIDGLVSKIGKAGMKGIMQMDAVARTIGWNGVYQKALAEGKSEAEAIRLAQNATLRTQPAASAKDIAAIYTNSETLNWLLMFSNQLSNMYNMAAYDLPRNFANKQFMKASLGVTSLALSALVMWAIAHRRLPEEPEDFANALGDQFINMIPLLGSSIQAARSGFGGGGIGVVENTADAFVAIENIVTGDGDGRDIAKILEMAAVTYGIPTVQPKRVIKAVTEGDVMELVGGGSR